MGYFVKNRQLSSGGSGIVLPAGSSAERPDAPRFGLIRYNTDSGYIEYFNGSIFQNLNAGGVVYTVDNFTGDGSTTLFGPMSIAVEDATDVIVFIGSIYQIPNTNYTVDGTVDITFTSAPPAGMPINVIHTSA